MAMQIFTTIFLNEADLSAMNALPPMEGDSFEWPEDVKIFFPNGEEWNKYGGYNAAGESIDYTPNGRGGVNSPCQPQGAVAGFSPTRFYHEVPVTISGIDTSMPSAWELAEED